MTASPIAAATVGFNPETRLSIDGELHEALQEEKDDIRAELIDVKINAVVL